MWRASRESPEWGQLLVDDGFVVRQAGRQRPVGVRLLLQVPGLLLGDGEVRWGLGGWCGSPVIYVNVMIPG